MSTLATLALTLGACAVKPPPTPAPGALASEAARERAERLSKTVTDVSRARWNPGRLTAARERAADDGLASLGHNEWIDWFALQRNHVIEIPGSGEGIAYIVAHYDKTDANPLKYASLMVNGLIDELIGFSYLSEGAFDNATGVAAALELARTLRSAEPKLTWRILLAGAEESGLRGSRAHVARLSDEEWSRIRFAVNIDSIAKDDSANCVITNASDPQLSGEAMRVAGEMGLPLEAGPLPAGAYGDHVPFQSTSFGRDLGRGLMFNMVGGLLPQRSWFTGSHGTRVLTFAACEAIDWTDLVAGALLLPTGRLHGPRDRTSRVDVLKLTQQVDLLEALLLEFDAEG